MRRRPERARGDCLFVYARGGNAGDDLIREGSIRFLRESGFDVVVSDGRIEAAALTGDRETLRSLVGGVTGPIVFGGGGNLGIYRESMIVREGVIHAADRARGFLVMPLSGPSVESALRDPRVTVWARDDATLTLLVRRGFRARRVLDAAFNMADVVTHAPAGDPSDAILIRREEGRCQERLPLWDLPIPSAGDLTFDASLREIMATLAPFGTVISDRLHGALIALMMGKRVGVLPVAYSKSESFVSTWLSGEPGVRYLPTRSAAVDFLSSDEFRVPADWRARFAESAEPALADFLRSTRRASVARIRAALPVRRSRPRILAVSIVKNEQDIIEPFVREHADLVDVHVIVDNASVDRTREILTGLAGEFPHLVVGDCGEFAFRQSERVTALLRQLQGIYCADFVLFLDADEFVDVPDRTALEAQLATIPVGGIGLFRWITHVVVDDRPATDAPRSMRHRRLSEDPQYEKAVLRIDRDPIVDVVVTQGSHDIVRQGAEMARVRLDAGLLHFPVRSRAQVAAKTVVGWTAYLARNQAMGTSVGGGQWQEIRDRVFAQGVDGIPLADVSATYARRPDAPPPPLIEVDRPWRYRRRFSDGSASDPFIAVARSWDRSYEPAPSGSQGTWVPGPRHPDALTDDRGAVRFIVQRFGARSAVFGGTAPEWPLDASGVDVLNEGGRGTVLCLRHLPATEWMSSVREAGVHGEVRAIIVVSPEGEVTGEPLDGTSPVPDGFVVDVWASMAVRALASADALRGAARVLVPRTVRTRGRRAETATAGTVSV